MSQQENSARCRTSEAWKGRWESCGEHSRAEGAIGVGRTAGTWERSFQFAGVCKTTPETGTWGHGVSGSCRWASAWRSSKAGRDMLWSHRSSVPGTKRCHSRNGQTGLQDTASLPRSGKRRARAVWDPSAIRRCLQKKSASKHSPLWREADTRQGRGGDPAGVQVQHVARRRRGTKKLVRSPQAEQKELGSVTQAGWGTDIRSRDGKAARGNP